ncbi:uncharacterized protein LOC124654360 [Lolium rigidum]|uniref:uncharacterized protein LOC124654360 n=1 Tax=Lolium rigidum TaxID=89674 RepID=UPI001F5CC463|nr:uncharacterized protein LOC124654360 [Lolium rigidum]
MVSVNPLDFEDMFDVEDLEPFVYGKSAVKKLDDEFEVEGLVPFLYDEATWVAWTEEEMERQRRNKEEKEQKEAEKERRATAHKKVMDSIIEYDPKVGDKVFTRFFLRDFSVFDINEKSPVLPMRYKDSKYKAEFGFEDSANILSISVVSSDEGFPVNVYGSIIARDSIDYKCIDLFHRRRDDCQSINLEGDTLVLTGPGRGLVLVDFIYLEIDLKIKKEGVYPDKQFSKGLITIDGRVLSRDKDVVVTSERLDSFRSTMEVRVATVLNAVEATFKFKLVGGDFDGKITAGMSDIDEAIVIYDSKKDGVAKRGVIKLRRRVMTVCVSSRRLLRFHVKNKAGGGVTKLIVDFTPQSPGSEVYEFQCGRGNLRGSVVWSLMDFRP